MSSTLFKNCFGHLPIDEQEQLRQILNAMTDVINKELKNMPVRTDRGDYELIQLGKQGELK